MTWVMIAASCSGCDRSALFSTQKGNLLSLNSQTLASFGPASIDNRLSRLRFHSGPETVGAMAFQIAGLKSSLAHCVSLLLARILNIAMILKEDCFVNLIVGNFAGVSRNSSSPGYQNATT